MSETVNTIQTTVSARTPRNRPPPFTLTEAAVTRVKELMATRGKPAAGLRIGVRSRGCSGLSYTIDFAEEKDPKDEIVETDGVTVLIDRKSTMFVPGTELDFVKDKLESRFVFRNPNEKGRCGCGESFHVYSNQEAAIGLLMS